MSARGKLLTGEEAAAHLGMKPSRLYALIRTGEIAALKHASGRLLGCYIADLDAWVERRRQPALAERPLRGVDQRMRQLIEEAS